MLQVIPLLLLEPVEGELEIPQEVVSEHPMGASKINRAGVIAGGTATVATVAEVLRAANEVKDQVAGLGTWLVPGLLVVIVLAAGWVVYQRFQQRKEGWA